MPSKNKTCFSAVLFFLLLSDTSLARSWFIYESPHLIVYSDASERMSKQLIVELEQFHAGILQLPTIASFQSSEKTVVIYLESRRQFKKLSGGSRLSAFFIARGNDSFMVVPSSFRMRTEPVSVRHEYIHSLQHQANTPDLAWYREGLAELLSNVKIDAERSTMRVGKITTRAKTTYMHDLPMDEIVSDGFRMDSISNKNLLNSAYIRAWLLTHYVTLGDDQKHVHKLRNYLELLRQDISSLAAFTTVFGKTPSELDNMELQKYKRSIPNYSFPFDASKVNTHHSVRKATDVEYRRIMNYLELSKKVFSGS